MVALDSCETQASANLFPTNLSKFSIPLSLPPNFNCGRHSQPAKKQHNSLNESAAKTPGVH